MRTINLIIANLFVIKAIAQDKPAGNAQEIADKLSNPVANMISVPLQSNLDHGIGQYNGSRYTLNVQPVVPIKLSPKLNLITRYIFPVIDQRDIGGENSSHTGLGDATITAFLSPAGTKGFIWAVGPAFLVPTATSKNLGAGKWGVGISPLVLRQTHGLTFGFLMNQLWSVGGDADRSDVNQMFFQPFFAKSWPSGAGVGLNAEVTCNWEANTTTTFLNPIATAVTKMGKQIVSFAVGPRIPLGGPEESKADFGLRGVITFVFAN